VRRTEQNFRSEAAFQRTLRYVHGNAEGTAGSLEGECTCRTKWSNEQNLIGSTAQDDDFQEVNGRKRNISNDTSETARQTTKSIPIFTAVKQIPKAVPTRNFFALLRTNEAPRKSGRPPPIMMTSTINLIRLQSDLKEHVKGKHEFRNTRNGTRIIRKEMTVYSAMKSYLEKTNLQCFTFSPNSVKPITPGEDISNSLEGLGILVINVRQLMTNGIAPNEQTSVETLPLFLVTLTRNVKSQ
jgi:hypothetical protein